MSGGISNAVLNAMDIGANSFALFLKSPRKWVSPDIKEEEIKKFHELCEKYGYNSRTDILPHGSYFINLGNPDPEKEEKAYGSFLDDLKRCEKLNIECIISILVPVWMGIIKNRWHAWLRI